MDYKPKTIKVIPLEGPSLDILQNQIDSLREILGNIHYSTIECACCPAIFHEDYYHNECNLCGSSICDQCIENQLEYEEFDYSTSRFVFECEPCSISNRNEETTK